MKPAKKTETDTAAERSAQMARVRGRDTKPELKVRRALHAAGLRYRLHDKKLPGRPDIVLPARKVVVFVHGCFWHRHPDPDCKLARLPKSRLDFWIPKLDGNRARDERKRAQFEALGWTVIGSGNAASATPRSRSSLATSSRCRSAIPFASNSGTTSSLKFRRLSLKLHLAL